MIYLNVLEIINAFSLIILVIITGFYVYVTHKILKEQVKTNRISEIIYELENVYSPIQDSLHNCITDSINKDSIERYNNTVTFLLDFDKIKKNYFHIIISDKFMIKFVSDIYSEIDKKIGEKFNIDDINCEFLLYIQYKTEEYNKEICVIKLTKFWVNGAEHDTKLKFKNFMRPKKIKKIKTGSGVITTNSKKRK